MKNLLLILFLMLSTFNVRANDFCPPKVDYPASLECSGQVFTANNIAQLQEYLSTYGDDGSGAKDLLVNFKLNNQVPEIHGPCNITVSNSTNVASLCLDAKSNLAIAQEVKLRSWGAITTRSQTGTSSFSDNTEIQGSIINVFSSNDIALESNVSWSGWSSFSAVSYSGSIFSNSLFSVQSNNIVLSSFNEILFGTGSRLQGHQELRLESQSFASFPSDVQITSNNIYLALESGLNLEGDSGIRGNQKIDLLFPSGDLNVNSGSLTTNKLLGEIGGSFQLGSSGSITAYQELSLQTNSYLLKDSASIQSNTVFLTALTTAVVESVSINSWQKITLDALTCTLSSAAVINSNLKLGKCFDPNQSPVAIGAVNPSSGYSPLEIQLDASESYDPDGTISSYEWTLPNGEILVGVQATTTISGSGTQNITLKVTDDAGGISQAIVNVDLVVDNTAPSLATDLENGTKFINNFPAIQFTYQDADSGIDPSSVSVLINNINVASNLVVRADGATLQFSAASPIANGSYSLVANVSDVSGNNSTIERSFFVDSGVATNFGVIGTIKNRLDDPLSGVNISLNSAPIHDKLNSTITDSNGFFRLPITTAGRYVVNIAKAGFAPQAIVVEPSLGVDFSLGDIFLLTTDPVIATINAETGGELVNSLGSKVKVPAGVLPTDVTISFTDYQDTTSFPGALPELSQFTYAFDYSSYVSNLNGEIEISLNDPIVDENGDSGFPLGTELVLGLFDPELGLWFDNGRNFTVVQNDSPNKDGPGGPAGNVPAIFPGDPNQPTVQPDSFDAQRLITHDDSQTSLKRGECIGCRINMENGNLAVDHTLPSVKVYGDDFPLEFSYNSLSAFPVIDIRESLEQETSFDPPVGGAYEIVAPGFRKSKVAQGRREARSVRATVEAKNENGEYLQTGVYPTQVTVTNKFTGIFASAAFFGAPANTVIIRPLSDKHGVGVPGAEFPSREPVNFPAVFQSFRPVINEKKSAFGSGWTMNGLSRLHFNNASSFLLLTDGRGGAFKYSGFSGNPIGGGVKKLNDLESLRFSNEIKLNNENGITYVSDCAQNQIFMVDSLGNTSVFAGTGTRGFTGDGGQALNAQLNCPTSITRSIKGDFFIADSGNLRIRKIDRNGIITTIGGNGEIYVGEEGSLATAVGIGRPVDIMVDDLLVVYYTTTASDVMMIDPRGKLRRFSSNDSGYVPHRFDGVASLDLSLEKRVMTMDIGKRQVVEIRPTNLSVQVEVDLGDTENLEKNGISEVAPLKQFVFDRKNNRFFVLDEAGSLFSVDANSNPKKITELSLVGSSLRKSSSIKDKSFNQAIYQISHSPEYGLMVVSDSGLKRFSNFNEKDAVGEVVDEYVSEDRDPSTLVLLDNGQFERTFKDNSKEIYNADGLLVARSNTRGHNTFYRYNTSQKLTEIELANTEKYLFSYDGRGYLVSITDPTGRQTVFDIDSNGQLLKITNPDGTFKQYAYDATDLLNTEIKENGQTERYFYNAGKIIRHELPGGRLVDIRPSDFIGDLDTPILNKIQEKLDGNSYAYFPSRSGDCELEIEIGFFVTAQKDCLGRRTTFINGASDVATSIRSPENRLTLKSYIDKDLLQSTVDGNGQTVFSYDNPFRKISKIKDQQNFSAYFTYNTVNGELESVTDKRNITTLFSYNEANLLSIITDSLGHQQNFTYGDRLELQSISDELGNITSFGRDLSGNITSVTDADNRLTQTQYDLMNRPTLVVDALGGETGFSYDASGLLTSLTDSLGRSTSYNYNAFNLVASEIRPDNTSLLYSYDNNERLTSVTQEDGSVLEYTYNLVGELLAITTLDDLVEFEYDDDGLLLSAIDNDSGVLMSYDEFARPVTEAQNQFANGVWNYNYNTRGDLIRSQFQILGGAYATLDYTPNANGDIEAIVATVNGQTLTWQRSYDQRNLPTQDTYNNGITINYQFDPARRLTLLENKFPDNKIISSFGFSYSGAGDITAIEEKLGGDGSLEPGHRVLNFGYDSLHRLIQSDLDEVDFTYDLLGNPNGSGYVTNVLNQLLESPSYEYAYDVRGNLIQQLNKLNSKVMNFTWSIDNRLMQVEIKNNGTHLSGRVAFGYDALGRRISKTWQDFSNPQNSYAKTFIYDREDLVMEVENEKITAFYVHAPGIDNPIAVLRDMNNNQEFNDDEVFFYTKDHLGSIRELVGLDGKLKQRQRYTAYGVTTREKNTDQLDRLIDHAYGFTGRELDSETGLYFYRARYYSVSDNIGRFISEDPIGFTGEDANFYRYVRNNPLNNSDPSGELSVGVSCALVLGGAGLINTGFDLAEISRILDEGEQLSDFFNKKADALTAKAYSCGNTLEKRKLRDLASRFRQDAFNSIVESTNEASFIAKNSLPSDLLQVAMSLSCNGAGRIIGRLVK